MPEILFRPAANWAARLRRPEEPERAADRIELRKFAGHQRHAQQLDQPLRVVHITDQHVGRVTPRAVQLAAVKLANAQQPDLTVLTGDFVCHGQAFLGQLEEVLKELQGPVFAVLGNHDHWSGAREVRQVLRRCSVELLDNVHTTITLNGQRLQLVGLDDAYTGHADVAKATRGLRQDLPTLGLSHIAEEADRLWEAGVPLVLSGHTHAGQITLAGFHELFIGRVAGHRYVHGLYGPRSEPEPTSGAVYVGAGIGAAVMPLRVGRRARREVTVFELGAEPGSFEEHHAEQVGHPGREPSARLKSKRAARVYRNHRRRLAHARRQRQRRSDSE